jgi:hypothetical protein
MKKRISFFLMLIIALSYSCGDDKPVADNTQRTGFDIGNVHYEATRTTSYQTDFGQLLKVNGENFELYIVLSDKADKIFSITDTLTGSASGKARCIIKLNSEYKFSVTGTIDFDSDKGSGNFAVNMEELNLKNGLIKVDTVINNAAVDFTSLTERDLQGISMNGGDINDWCVRTDWDIVERLVFNLKTIATPSGNTKLIEYPNPFSGSLLLNLAIPPESKIDLFLVNSNFEIEQKFIGLQYGNAALLIDNAKYQGNYYRLFYRIYSVSEQYYGSGDLKVLD